MQCTFVAVPGSELEHSGVPAPNRGHVTEIFRHSLTHSLGLHVSSDHLLPSSSTRASHRSRAPRALAVAGVWREATEEGHSTARSLALLTAVAHIATATPAQRGWATAVPPLPRYGPS